jgi:hypothetical protein
MKLNKDDYLIWPHLVHIMRYRGLNDEGKRYWSTACGTKFSEVTWYGMSYQPTLEEVEQQNIAVCKRCNK